MGKKGVLSDDNHLIDCTSLCTSLQQVDWTCFQTLARKASSWTLRPKITCKKFSRCISLNLKLSLTTTFTSTLKALHCQATKTISWWSCHVNRCWKRDLAGFQFWCCDGMAEYPSLATHAVKTIQRFCKIYFCKSGFSTLVQLKSKQRNGSDTEHDL